MINTTSKQIVITPISQEQKVNENNNTNYPISSNAVKLLPYISNNNGKIKLYTEINSNLKIGDKVFIMFNSNNHSTTMPNSVILDNYLEFLNCTDNIYLKQMQGYEIIEINDSNNEITIDRYYDYRLVNKKIYDHYIAKIYIRNIDLFGGEIDGAEILQGNFNTINDSNIDINLVQSVIFSGNSFFMRFKDKYDNSYISTNSSLTTGSTTSNYKPYIYLGRNDINQEFVPSSSYLSNNNLGFGYNYIQNQTIRSCKIDNGTYDYCYIIDSTINGGSFNKCTIINSTINYGVFNDVDLDSNSYWFNGIWNGGVFGPITWYDGTWNTGDFIGKDWRLGLFNDGLFSGSTWRNGIFQNGIFNQSTWFNGSFNNGQFINSIWTNGIFNGGNMQSSTWENGTCNNGNLLNIEWDNGIFNNGSITSSYWYNGTFNNGNIITTYWENGTFNNGTFNSQNNIPLISSKTLNISGIDKYWKNGTFKGGNFINSLWSGGTFYNGSFSNSSVWLSGIYKNGEFSNSSWVNGVFENGIVNDSYFHNVDWTSGIWNSGTIGIALSNESATVNWSGGTFNNGIFGDLDVDVVLPPYIYWWNGDFYKGTFNNLIDDNCSESFGGFYNGTFHNGYFNGTFWGGIWITGVFNGCNKTTRYTLKTVKNEFDPNITLNFRLGDLEMKKSQQNNIT